MSTIMCLLRLLILELYFSLSYTYENIRMIPRLTQLNPGSWSCPLPSEQPNAVFYLDSANSLYIGGDEVLYHYDFKTMENYTMKAEKYNCQGKMYCKNYVTYVTRINEDLIICGTNAYNPACWKMDGEKFERQTLRFTEQLSPPAPGLSYEILNTGNEIYSTIPRQSNNAASTKKTTFRKILGNEPMRYTGGNLLKNPQFVKSILVEGEQKMDSRIFLFFMDDNSEQRTTDKRVPMIARMCKEEMGSEKPDERIMFSTALKARLMCGNSEGQYYNVLQDIFFLKSQSLVYGLFTNPWNYSSVCTYRIDHIESVFNTSELFQSSKIEKIDLKIRPGKCLSKYTPQETAEEAARHPELADWVWPSENQTIFQTLNYYKKLVVDEIKAHETVYRVIIVATDNGTLRKVVELDDGPTNILEMHPFNGRGKIIYMDLVSNNSEHYLYVGTTHDVSRIPLDDCRVYNNSCTYCIASRDPYCGWYEGKCQSILKNSEAFQDFTQGAMCEQEGKILAQRTHSYTSAEENDGQLPSFYVLTCPAESRQATYWWMYDNHKERCTPQNGTCKLLIHKINRHAEYMCVEEEFSKQRFVSKFELGNRSSRNQYSWLVALAYPVCITLYIHLTLSVSILQVSA